MNERAVGRAETIRWAIFWLSFATGAIGLNGFFPPSASTLTIPLELAALLTVLGATGIYLARDKS